MRPCPCLPPCPSWFSSSPFSVSPLNKKHLSPSARFVWVYLPLCRRRGSGPPGRVPLGLRPPSAGPFNSLVSSLVSPAVVGATTALTKKHISPTLPAGVGLPPCSPRRCGSGPAFCFLFPFPPLGVGFLPSARLTAAVFLSRWPVLAGLPSTWPWCPLGRGPPGLLCTVPAFVCLFLCSPRPCLFSRLCFDARPGGLTPGVGASVTCHGDVPLSSAVFYAVAL